MSSAANHWQRHKKLQRLFQTIKCNTLYCAVFTATGATKLQQVGHTVKPLILATLNFGIRVNLIILDPVILAFLLPTTLKCYCIQIFTARYFRELVGSRNSQKTGTRKNGFYSI